MAGALPGQRAPNPPTSLLCIDDQAEYLPVRKTFLESHGYRVLLATSGQAGLDVLGKNRSDAVVLDYRMPGMDGGEVAREIRRTRPDLPIILLTGFPRDIPPAVRSVVNAVVLKGESPMSLLRAIEATLPEIILQPRTETVSRDSIELTRKRIHHIKEVAAQRQQRIGRR